MTGKELDDVRGRIEQEGFDYCFRFYSTFPEIKDPQFQLLRTSYVKAANDLAEYLNLEEV